MSVNIGQLKQQLQALGISTNTPGLFGDDRYEELRKRLDNISGKIGTLGLNIGCETAHQQKLSEEASAMLPTLNHLSIGEIRSRLTSLGESTATPDMTGDERRNELLRRLINAICKANSEAEGEENNDVLSEFLVTTHKTGSASPPQRTTDGLHPPVTSIKDIIGVVQPQVPLEEINELKKDLKRLVNKRSMYVASKLSGANQDTTLRECEINLNKIDAELSVIKTVKSKGVSQITVEMFRSDFIDTSTQTSPDMILLKLESLRARVKDEIRDHRVRIREEGDLHPDFGLQGEERIKEQLIMANLTNSTSSKSSRMRRKIDESKELENKLNAVALLTAVMAAKETTKTNTTAKTSPTQAMKASNSKPSISPAHTTESSAGSGQKVNRQKSPLFRSSFLEETDPYLLQSVTSPTVVSPTSNKQFVLHKSASDVSSNKSTASNALSPTGTGNTRQLWLSKSPPVSSSSFHVASSSSVGAAHSGVSLSLSPVAADSKQYNSPDGQRMSHKSPKASPKDSNIRSKYCMPTGKLDDERQHSVPASSSSNSTVRVETVEDDDSDDSDDDGIEELPSSRLRQRQRDETHIASLSPKQKQAIAQLNASPRYDQPQSREMQQQQKESGGKQPVDDNKQSLSSSGGVPIEHQQFKRPSGDPPMRHSSQDYSSPSSKATTTGERTNTVSASSSSKSSPHRSLTGQDDDTNAFTKEGQTRSLSVAPVRDGDDNNDNHEQEMMRRTLSHKQSMTSVATDVDAEGEDDDAEGEDDDAEGNNNEANDADDGNDNNDEDEEVRENNIQIRILREHAKTLEGLNDIPAAEECLERALALDPTNIATLQTFALFLHTKKGELSRAEAFFNRGLQICLPGLNIHVMNSARNSTANNTKSNTSSVSDVVALKGKPKPLDEKEGFSTSPGQGTPQSLSPVGGPGVAGTKSAANATEGTGNSNPPAHSPHSAAEPKHQPQSQSQSKVHPQVRPPLPKGPPQGVRVKHIIRFILSFAHFLTKSTADIEAASILYHKAVELAPEDARVLSTFAHFLSQEASFSSGPNSIQSKNYSEEAVQLFKRALLIDPSNVMTTLWYAKLLKKLNKFGQAELMYKVALEKSKGMLRLEPTAICNYATFIFKQRKDPEKAQALFTDGLERFPNHKGLVKNYCTMLRQYKHLGSAEEVRRRTPKTDTANQRVERILSSINSANNLAVMSTANHGSNNASSGLDLSMRLLGSTPDSLLLQRIGTASPTKSRSVIPTKQAARQSSANSTALKPVTPALVDTTHKKVDDEDDEDERDATEDLKNNPFIKRIKGTPGLGKKIQTITAQHHSAVVDHDSSDEQLTRVNTSNNTNTNTTTVVHTANTSEVLVPWSEEDGMDLFFSQKSDRKHRQNNSNSKQNDDGGDSSDTDADGDGDDVVLPGSCVVVDAKSGRYVQVKGTAADSFLSTLSPSQSFVGKKY